MFTASGEEALSLFCHCCAPESVQEQQATQCTSTRVCMDARRAQSHTQWELATTALQIPLQAPLSLHSARHRAGPDCFVCLAKPHSAVVKGPVRDRDQEQGQVQPSGF